MFLILISLSSRSHTRGDQSHIFATPGVHDDEEAATPISSQGDPPFLVLLRTGLAWSMQGFLEHSCGIRKTDTVFSEVRTGFSWVPFIVHSS